MQLQLTRAHRVFLGLSGEESAGTALPTLSSGSLSVSQEARAYFRTQLATTGAYRSGPLFGFRDATSLWVGFAAQGGYWTEPPDEDEIFRMDSGYILGWTDALRTALPLAVDWVGQWVSFPDGQAGHAAEEEALIRRAGTLGLLDRHHVLLFIGWSGDELSVEACFSETAGSPV